MLLLLFVGVVVAGFDGLLWVFVVVVVVVVMASLLPLRFLFL